MIVSLDDAQRWYEHTRALAVTSQRLAAKHWDDLPWDGPLGRDSHLNQLTTAHLQDQSDAVLEDLDDLGVLLLFSVFEAIVRTRVLAEIEEQLPTLRHPVLDHAVTGVREAIEHGSFFRVLEPYKPADASLVEEVNQVRRYRNWVAHGRHGQQPNAVDPQIAYDRLRRFLGWLDSFETPESIDAATS